MKARAVLAFLALFALTSSHTRAMAGVLTCRPYTDLSVEVEGAYPGGARFYQSDVRGKFFIDIPACKNGLLMDTSTKRILAVPRTLVNRSEDVLKVQDVLPPSTPSYAFSIDGPIIQFEAEDKKVRILPVLMRPPLIGPIALDALLADRPEYPAGMKNYVPESKSIAALRKSGRKLEIEAFFATWCSHCKDYMPRFLRVMQDARNPNISLNLIGVPKNFGAEQGPWQGKSIQSIPAIIVKSDGREVTRLGTQPGAMPERELAGILEALR